MLKTERVTLRRPESLILAVRVTVDNLEELAAWCGGCVKGVALPRLQQQIRVYSPESDEEQSAKVGDWIVNFGTLCVNDRRIPDVIVLTNDRFELRYQRSEKETA